MTTNSFFCSNDNHGRCKGQFLAETGMRACGCGCHTPERVAPKACTVCHIRETKDMPFGLAFGKGNSNNCAKHAHLPNAR